MKTVLSGTAMRIKTYIQNLVTYSKKINTNTHEKHQIKNQTLPNIHEKRLTNISQNCTDPKKAKFVHNLR